MFDDLDDGRAHGRDERIGVVAFKEDVDFTYRLMKVLARKSAQRQSLKVGLQPHMLDTRDGIVRRAM
jgi:hypothetical protein